MVSRISVLVLLAGTVVTALLSWSTYVLNDHNESRLLKLQTKTARSILEVAVPVVQTPLASAAAIAATSNGDAARFRSYVSTYVGTKGPFVSVSLWERSGSSARLITHAGATPLLTQQAGRAETFVASAATSSVMLLTTPIDGAGTMRLGYGFAGTNDPVRYVVYAESALPPNRRIQVDRSSPLSDLRFALYAGDSTAAGDLLETNAARLPLTGKIAKEVIPFGGGTITLVATPDTQLGGALSGSLWWILALAGAALAIALSLVAERLVRRRLAAERLTGEVEHLLGEQRSIAVTLQRALLPRELPEVAGVATAVRYIPGSDGVDIGGDWYDVIPLDADRFFFAVGDVSGRGLEAGSIMASLRFATRGFVSEGHGPTAVLNSLARLLSVEKHRHFATMLCGVADVPKHEVEVAIAGHPPPLVLGAEGGRFVDAPVGPPIGVRSPVPYRSVTATVSPGGILLAYTDGLVERRGESLDVGLGRLCASAVSAQRSLDDLLTAVVAEVTEGGQDDDTAILGVKWLS
ncbi:MAG: hypothetical protein QOE97_2421 [Pseudonocardiales bacterium]|jgi:serine phosphatase RsbU (regulator of sigma subunit)|nr:hypothetical protein [Pseudonocardiales bacterium]